VQTDAIYHGKTFMLNLYSGTSPLKWTMFGVFIACNQTEGEIYSTHI